MIQRYLEIHQFLDDGEDSEITEFLLGPADHKRIKELSSIFQDFESVTQALQNSTRNLHEIRCLFDGVIAENSSMRSYLCSDADIVHSKEFEVAIAKLQGGSTDLTHEETISLSKLRRINDSSEVLVLPNNTSLAERALSKQVRKKVQYFNIQDNIGTSNIAERLFSVAGNICTPSSSSMCSTTFEETLFLKASRKFWDIKMICDIIDL